MSGQRRSSPGRRIAAVLAWVVISAVLVWRLPIWAGMVYVLACWVGSVWYRRHDDRTRRIQLRDGHDLLRGGQTHDVADRPSGRGFGAHSWARRRTDDAGRGDDTNHRR